MPKQKRHGRPRAQRASEKAVKTIRIDLEVWRLLKRNAAPLEDTPNSVLRRLLGLRPLA